MRSSLRWGLLGLVTVGALLALAPSGSAEEAWLFNNRPGQCIDGDPGPGVTAIWASDDFVYVSRYDGVVVAFDWSEGRIAWQVDLRAVYGPRVQALDLEGDSARLYVALSDTSNAAGRAKIEPLVALWRTNGTMAWDTAAAWNPFTMPDDPLRMAGDANFLYVGTRGGSVVKVAKVSGAPVINGATGQPLEYLAPDHPLGYPKGIYAIATEGGRIWAGLNYGGEAADDPNPANPTIYEFLDTSIANRFLILDTNTLQYAAGVAGPLRIGDPDSNPGSFDQKSPRALGSVFSIWSEPGSATAAEQAVYLVARGVMGTQARDDDDDNRTYGIVMAFNQNTNGVANPVDGNRDLLPLTAARVLTSYPVPPETATGPPAEYPTPILGPITEVVGDGNHIYVTGWVNKTTGQDDFTFPAFLAANVLKLERQTLADSPDWLRPNSPFNVDQDDIPGPDPDDHGRRFQASDVLSLYADYVPGAAGTGRLIAGHACIFDAAELYGNFPSRAAPADDNGVVRQHEGALLTEVPKDATTTSAVLMFPAGGEITNGTFPIGFRTDLPSAGANTPDTRIEFFIRDENAADPAWVPMEGLRISDIIPNFHLVSDNVLFTWQQDEKIVPLPEGTGYRLRMELRDATTPEPGPALFRDTAEGTFTIDRTPPVIQSAGPLPQANRPFDNGTFRIDVRASDGLSDISRRVSGVFIDGRGWPCLRFDEDANGRATGFNLDIAWAIEGDNCPNLNDELRRPLADGFHVIRVEVLDRARNFGFSQWVVDVDTHVREPLFYPAPNSWLTDTTPTFVSQFYEDLKLRNAYLDGVDITTRIGVQGPNAEANPLGTRFTLQVTEPLATGRAHHLELWVVDKADHIGGPFIETIRLDSVPPVLSDPVPAPGSLVTDAQPIVALHFTDAASGVQAATLKVFVDGFDQSRTIEGTTSGFSLRPVSELAAGPHAVEARVQDVAGNVEKMSWTFLVDLDEPIVDVRAELPPGQIAVKRGDDLRFRIRVTDGGQVRSVGVEGQALDPELLELVPAVRSASEENVWEATVKILEDRTRTVRVRAFATDAGDHVGVGEVSVLIDNSPPVVFMQDLAPYVGATFSLAWGGDRDDIGSGVSYHILERQIADGPWLVINPRVEAKTIELGFAESEPTVLRYRVSAVDGAGNQQTRPSNAAETIARGDPFETLFYESTFVEGREYTFTASPIQGIDVEGANVTAHLYGTGGADFAKLLPRTDRLFTGSWSLKGIPPGDYVLRFHLTGLGESTLVSKSYPVTVIAAPPEAPLEVQGDGGNKLPAMAPLGIVVALGVGLMARTRRLR